MNAGTHVYKNKKQNKYKNKKQNKLTMMNKTKMKIKNFSDTIDTYIHFLLVFYICG